MIGEVVIVSGMLMVRRHKKHPSSHVVRLCRLQTWLLHMANHDVGCISSGYVHSGQGCVVRPWCKSGRVEDGGRVTRWVD